MAFFVSIPQLENHKLIYFIPDPKELKVEIDIFYVGGSTLD